MCDVFGTCDVVRCSVECVMSVCMWFSVMCIVYICMCVVCVVCVVCICVCGLV